MARYKFVSKMFAGRQNVLELGCGDAFNAPILRPRLRDPNDEMVLEAAAIVTFNKRYFRYYVENTPKALRLIFYVVVGATIPLDTGPRFALSTSEHKEKPRHC